MSTPVMEMLLDQLGPDAGEKLGAQVGTDRKTANRAIAGALPVLLGAMTKNASDSSGAEALLGALMRDHDGALLDNLSSFLGAPDQKDGAGILGHLLGGKKSQVEQSLGAKTGLDAGQIAKVLATLAPIVMAAVGRQQRQKDLDSRGLRDMLEQEQARVAQSSDMGGLGKMLDRDGDGSFVDDIAGMGASILGGFLKNQNRR